MASDEEESKNNNEEYVEPKLYEYIFLIDRSGSMQGQPIKLAVEALKLFLHSLPMGSKFNIVSFGSKHEMMFPSSQEYNEQSLQNAMTKLSKFDANMGGTEIYEPVNEIFTLPSDPKLPRHLYLLTDGAVANTRQLVDLIRANRDNCRVHTFGIGSGASSELIKDCAFAGQGHYSFIYKLEEIELRVMEALQKDFLEYLSIQEASFLSENNEVIKVLPKDDFQLAHGIKFFHCELLFGD